MEGNRRTGPEDRRQGDAVTATGLADWLRRVMNAWAKDGPHVDDPDLPEARRKLEALQERARDLKDLFSH